MMNGTSYVVLYDSVLSKIKDYDFASLSEEDVYNILFDYIRPAVVDFKSCKHDLTNRNDVEQRFNFNLSDVEIEILSDFMLVHYLNSTYINTPMALKQQLSSKDFNTFSPSAQLAQIVSVRDKYKKETQQLMRDYSFVDSPLFNIVTKE